MPEVMIINSPLFRETNPLYDEDSLPPIGLGLLATALAQEGISVALVDAVASRIALAELIELVTSAEPSVIAINIFTTNYELVKEFVESLSAPLPHIIVGGLATRTLYSKIFDWTYPHSIDIVFGDGESIIRSLVTGEVAEPPSAELHNRRYFRVDSQSQYYLHDISAVPLDRTFFVNEPIAHKLGFLEAHIVASRGCIYDCSFCAAARSLNQDLTVRERSVESLRAELSYIQAELPDVSSIRVLDDLFLKGRRCIARAIDVFAGFPYQWRSMAHVLTFQGVGSAELVRLRESGCQELFIGVESGSERILKAIHKTHDVSRILSNLEAVLSASICLKAYFIYGFPGETRDDFDKTFLLASRLKDVAAKHGAGFRTSVFQFRPYHGTELYHMLQAQGATDDVVMHVSPNKELSALVGRLQFNFHSGNYSAEPLEILQDYIYRTANLTDPKQWGIEE